MRNLFALFFERPPNLGMSLDLWRAFKGEVYGWSIGSIIVGVLAIASIYAIRSRSFAIRYPSDPFRTFTPMGWFGLSALPGLLIGCVYAVRYLALFRDAVVSPVAGAVGSALAGAALTLLLVQLASWIPGVTPHKVLYHPRWPWRLLDRRRS